MTIELVSLFVGRTLSGLLVAYGLFEFGVIVGWVRSRSRLGWLGICFGVAAFGLATVALCAAVHAGESTVVQLYGPSTPSLWRLNNGDWQSVSPALTRGGWITGLSLDPGAEFDLRAGGVPWFSTHVAPLPELKEFSIYVGERQGGYQQFSYGGVPVTLPV